MAFSARDTSKISNLPFKLSNLGGLILARLAVDQREQGRGLGAALLKDALRRAAKAADIAGIRALFVHAKDNEAQTFYEHFHFRPSPTDPHHLFLLMKDLLKMTAA